MTHTLKILIFSLLIAALLAACAPTAQVGGHSMAMAPMSGMPDEVKASAKTVQTAYQYAVANPDVLKEIPCYCGCGAAGHHSNYACYVQSTEGDKVTFDMHATGCSICVDITQDTMRMAGEGKSVTEIRTAIDEIYSRFGPSNMQ